MKYEKISELKDEEFKWITGVKKSTFEEMVKIVKEADRIKKAKGGKKNKLCIEDMILMMLEYYREYRTYFHISVDYGISESNTWQTIKWIEGVLIKSGKFTLPGKKELLKSDFEYEIIMIDATETPVERPEKKTEKILFRKKEKTYCKNTSCCKKINNGDSLFKFCVWKNT